MTDQSIAIEKLLALIIEQYGTPNLYIPVDELRKDMSKWAIAIDPEEKEDGSFDRIILSLVEEEDITYDEDPS